MSIALCKETVRQAKITEDALILGNLMSKKLTLKQKVFCEHYAASGNGAAAARAAGYKNPEHQGYENHKKPQIKKYLLQLSKHAESKRIANYQGRQRILTLIIRDEIPRIDPESGKNLGQLTRDRLKAIELLGKMQGDFIERVHHEGELESQVQFYLPKNERD